MKIIISPAKKMNVDSDTYEAGQMPEFISDAEILLHKIKSLSYAEAKALWKCNDQLAKLNYERFQTMDLSRALTPAIMTYEGLQYQHMAPGIFTEGALSYVRERLRILSGFYGVLRPFDKVLPYRLEMQAKLSVNGSRDLYGFWGDRLYQSLLDDDRTILNLASKEYSQCIERYVTPDDRFLTVEFGEWKDGKIKQKGTLAKMARGEMVRFLAENQIDDLERIREFHELGFHYAADLSERNKYVFIL